MSADFRKNKDPFHKIIFAAGEILLLVIFIILIVADIRVYQKKQKLASELENLKNNIQDFQKKNDDLKQGTLNENNNQYYVEKVAREELDLQKPGEKVVYFVKQSDQQKENQGQKNILQNWLGWFMGFLKK